MLLVTIYLFIYFFGHFYFRKGCLVCAGAIRGPRCLLSKEAKTKEIFCALKNATQMNVDRVVAMGVHGSD